MDIQFSQQDFSGLSFQDAFELARTEMGSTGIFYWNGQPFNTLLADEQASMVASGEWADFSSSVQSALAEGPASAKVFSATADLSMQPDLPEIGGFSPEMETASVDFSGIFEAGTADLALPSADDASLGGLLLEIVGEFFAALFSAD